MVSEFHPSADSGPEEETNLEARLRADRFALRVGTKNLIDGVRVSPVLPSKERLLELLNEILVLVPALSPKEEDEEEDDRFSGLD